MRLSLFLVIMDVYRNLGLRMVYSVFYENKKPLNTYRFTVYVLLSSHH